MRNEVQHRREVGRVDDRGQALSVLQRLGLDADKCVTGGLGFKGSDGFAINKKQIVGKTVALGHLEFADSDARPRGKVHFVAALGITHPAKPSAASISRRARSSGFVISAKQHSSPVGAAIGRGLEGSRRRSDRRTRPDDVQAARPRKCSRR